MTRIILARHGETEWNAGEVFRGRRDVGLNEAGIRQAELLGDHLADLTIEAVYSSPQKRALDTARSVARHHGLDVVPVDGLMDFNFGAWEGVSRVEVRDRDREFFERWLREPHLVRVPDGETLDEVRERARSVVDWVISEHGGTVVLVSHRVVNKVLICALLGLDNSHYSDILLDLAAITVFDHEDGRFRLFKHNDTCHLRQIGDHPLGDF